MNGVLFYLDRDVPLVHGHAIYIDSEWALTSISQAQFWKDVDLARYGDGRVKGILSVDVSDWDTPGRRTGKVAMRCSKEEIRAEVWGQLVDHIDDGSLDERHVLAWFLDPAITFPNPTEAANLEPLLINTAGSWADRPGVTTRIPNLLLAADYVRTNTDLATMEGANEAARRAVNAILDRTGSARASAARSTRCPSRPCCEPARRARPSCAGGCSTGPREAAAAGRRRTAASSRPGCSRARRSPPGRLTQAVADALEPRLAAAGLQRAQPERLERPERAGAVDALAGGAARGPGQDAGGQRVRLAAGQVDLGEPLAGGVVGLGHHPRDARAGLVGPADDLHEPVAGRLQRAAHAGHAQRHRAGQAAGLQRPGERAEPAEVDVDLLEPRMRRPAARSARSRRSRPRRGPCRGRGTSARARRSAPAAARRRSAPSAETRSRRRDMIPTAERRVPALMPAPKA